MSRTKAGIIFHHYADGQSVSIYPDAISGQGFVLGVVDGEEGESHTFAVLTRGELISLARAVLDELETA